MRPFLALLVVAACGGGSGMNNDTPGDDQPPVDASSVDAYQPPEGFTKLVGATWSMTAGQKDTYVCARFTVAAETYITNIVAQAPTGTHHTVLSIADSRVDGPDGQYNCNVQELGMVMLYASGVGTSPLDFPSGVGVKIAAGTQVHVNLHLFNASDNALAGESGIYIKSQSTPTPTLAEMVFAGDLNFTIPANAQNFVVTGGCTANRNFTLFALWPHMHQIANHSKFDLNTQVLHDKAYDFNEQTYYLKSPEIQVQQGDQIKVTCTYNNTTSQPVVFGDSSNDEMCFVGMYRYPAGNGSIFDCASF
jgi:Copper type II ascorbate-dependent monooxygenase, C-terminal domain